MIDINIQDEYFEVRLGSMLSNVDRQILTDLYEPIIGHLALSLYFTLWALSKRRDLTPYSSHESLFIKMQIGTSEFLRGREALEALGLLKSFLRKEGESSSVYVYVLFSPKYPNDFFNDVIYRGLLVKYVGEKEANRLKSSYQNNAIDGSLIDISASFGKVFHPDFDDVAFKTKLVDVSLDGRVVSKIDTEFSFARFFDYVKEKGMLREDAFDDKSLKEIERLSALYGVNELSMGEAVLLHYNPSLPLEERIDFNKVSDMLKDDLRFPLLNKKAPKINVKSLGSSALAGKIKLMEELSSKDYLRVKQNNTMPTRADLSLIDNLSKNLALNTSTINAIVDFVLEKNNNVLSRAYTEKIAASLAREGIDNAIDAMNYLRKVNRAMNKKTNEMTFSKKKIQDGTKEDSKKQTKEMSDEQLDDILNMIGNK